MSTSIARKFVMGITGLFLITFIALHLLINSFSLICPELFNKASHFMATNFVIQSMQYVLAAGFIIHIGMGIRLTIQNKKARPIGYVQNNASVNSGISARSMIITGFLILLFLVLHIRDFFIPIKFCERAHYLTEIGGSPTLIHDDFALMGQVFGNPLYTALYVIAFIALALHLNHGFQSAFQSMGVNHKKYTPMIKKASTLFCVVVGVGFSAIAIFHFMHNCH